MKTTEMQNGIDLKPLKIPAQEVPHAVIETNYTCNRRCALCYNHNRDIVKSFDQIASEIRQVLEKRNLETISILGGEPTLHPLLPEVVSYIKSKNLVCQILTNGLVLYKDSRNLLLDRLVEAGLDRIVVHIDCGQGLTEQEIDTMCEHLFTKFERRRLYFAISVTLYPQNQDAIPALMRRYARFRYFDGVLVTLARDAQTSPAHPAIPMPDLSDVYACIARGLSVEPSSYIPSNLDDKEVRWLMYFYYLNPHTGATFGVSPALIRFFRRAYRLLMGKHLFAATMKASLFKIWFSITAALELLFRPSRIVELVRLISGSSLLNQLRFHYIVLQSAPQVTQSTGPVEICYHCPDATIRNGRLAPVCLADWISPPGKNGNGDGNNSALATAIYNHLEAA